MTKNSLEESQSNENRDDERQQRDSESSSQKPESAFCKHTFVHKIKGVIEKGLEIDSKDYNYSEQLASEKLLPQSPVDKKQRNKQSAKQSRQRKKIYISILETKEKNLQKMLLQKKKELEETKDYLDRVTSQNKTISGFTTGRHQLIKKLQALVYDSEHMPPADRDQQINTLIDNLRYRIGATGKERIKTINEYFRQIVNLSLPALHRYMMWSATEQNHLFNTKDEEENDEWYKELRMSLHLTEQQLRQIQQKKEFLQTQRTVLQGLIGDLKEVKCEIEEKSIDLEDLIDKVREILTPLQCGIFILFIEKNKYRKELNLCEKVKKDAQLEKNDQEDQCDRKLPKKILKAE